MAHFLRRFVWGLAVPLVLAAAALAWLHSSAGEDFTARKLAEETGIQISGFRLDWPFNAHADSLKLTDSQGPWAELIAPELQWRPLRLLRGRLDIQRLAVERALVARLPVSQGGGGGGDLWPRLNIRISEISASIALAAPVLGDPVALLVRGSFQMGSGQASLSGGAVDVQLRADDGSVLRLSGKAGTDFVDLRWNLRAPHLNRWQRLAGVPLTGEASGSGFLAGRLPRPAISGLVEIGPGGVADAAWKSLRVEGQVIPQEDKLQAALSAQIEAPSWRGAKPFLPSVRLIAAGDVDVTQGRALLGNLRAEGDGMAVWGSGLVQDWGRQAVLRVQGRAKTLAGLMPGLRGGGEARALVVGDMLAPRLRADIHLYPQNLSTGVAVADRLLGASPRLQAGMRLGPDLAPRLVMLRAEGARAALVGQGVAGQGVLDGWLRLDVPALSALAPQMAGAGIAWARVRGDGVFGAARLSGLRAGKAPSLDGMAMFDFRNLARAPSGAVSAAVMMAGMPLNGSVRVAFPRGGEVSLRDLALRSGASRLSGDLELTSNGVRGFLDGSIPQLKDWAELAFLPFDGGLEARAVFENRDGQVVRLLARAGGWRGEVAGAVSMQGEEGTARLERVRVARGGSALVLAAPTVVRWSPNRVALERAELVVSNNGVSNGGELGRGTVEGAATLPQGNLRGQAEFSGDVARLAEFAPLSGQVAQGRINGSAQVSGSLDHPLVDGRAVLSNGRLENLDSGAIIAKMEAVVVFQGETLRLTLSGTDGADGTLRGQGEAGLDGSWRGNVSFRDFTALRRDDVQASGRGELELSGHNGEGNIAGQVTVQRAEVDLGRLKGGGPTALEVVEINRPSGLSPLRAASPARKRGGGGLAGGGAAGLVLATDVTVEHAFVRGRGLDSEWQGQAHVAGPVASLALTGRVQAVRGEYELLGRQFRLTPESAVLFEGGQAEDATLDVAATARAEEVTARVQVTGTLRQPDIGITSEPPLPQDEVLARLLFGREAGKLSAFQQLQLAQMATSGLWDKGGGDFDPLGKLRGALGLDVLGVGGGEPGQSGGGPTLSAGKYVGRDTFVRVDQGAQGLGKVTVEQELGRGFSVETGVGQQGGGGVGFSWRKNY